MDNQDYIHRAVEEADGWSISKNGVLTTAHNGYFGSTDDIEIRDALAAQLRLQAQANPYIVFNISVVDSASFVEMLIYNPNGDEEAKPLRFVANEVDEATAFFKVIIDSGVLAT